MTTVVYEQEQLHIPSWVVDLNSFRRWAESDAYPEAGRVCYLKGGVWADMTKQQIFTHVRIKSEIAFALLQTVREDQRGLYLPDGVFLTNTAAGISVIPDGVYVSKESIDAGEVRLVEGAEHGFTELEGSPDMVLEVVSDSSVRKDTVWLNEAYWVAGIREYWLVDVRKQPARFDLLKHAAKGYVATRKQGGWVKSNVFGRSYRVTQSVDHMKLPTYLLEAR
jgi:Uma2 family endonuclease